MSAPLRLLSGLVLEDGRRWGDVASDHQRADAAAVLDLVGPRRHFQTRPRGGSKTTDLAAAAVAVLLDQAPAGSRSYAVAVDADQAGLLLGAMAGFVRRSGLDGDLQVMASQVVNRRTSAALEVLPADSASAWGLTPFVVIADEIAQWPSTRNHRALWEAVVSSLQKRRDSRLICLTSAGDPAHWSARVFEAAKASALWRVSEMPGPVSWQSPADLEDARASLMPASYERLILNRWAAPDDALTSVEDLRACVRHEGVVAPRAGERYLLALDIGLTNDATVLLVGHRTTWGDGSVGVVLDRLDRWRPSKGRPVDLVEVGERIAELSRRYNGAPLIFDPYNAAHLTQLLHRRGVRSQAFTFSGSSVGVIAQSLFRALRDGAIDLPDDEDLLDELAHVRLRSNAYGVVRMDHDSGRHDDQAIALALLVHGLLEARVKRRRSIVHVSAMASSSANVPRQVSPSALISAGRADIERMIAEL